MQRLQAFKFELMPNGGQARDMRRFAGACRFVFNKALDLQQKTYASKKKQLSFAQLCKHLVAWKQEFAWLKESPSQALQQSLKDLDRAYQNFFAQHAAFPKFKKKGQQESFRFPQGFKIDQPNSRIFLPKLGWMRYRNSRTFWALPKTSPSANQAASGLPAYKQSAKSNNLSQQPPAPSALMLELPALPR